MMTQSSNAILEFSSVIEEIERCYPVAHWLVRGVPVWPIVRTAARYELTAPRAVADTRGAPPRSQAHRAMRHAAAPLLDPVRHYRDWSREALLPTRADALFLTNGVSQDRIAGVWRDRYCAPLIEALGAEGLHSLLMHPGDAQRLPREHTTYSAHWIESWSRIAARLLPRQHLQLDSHEAVRRLVRKRGLNLTAFDMPVILQSATRIAVMARLFDYVLARTRPKVFFTVKYYWDLGFAANLACRRRGILSVDIQHGGQDGQHPAYDRWAAVPPCGYPVLPAVFWNWSRDDAQAINDWAGRLAPAWHVGLWGGHPQIAEWLDDSAELTRKYDATVASCKERRPGDFDILVALQDVDGYAPAWDMLADVIRASPRTWRWWLRRHPAPACDRDVSTASLIALDQPNVMIEEATSLPLPALLRNVGAVVCLMSGVAVEAAFFGHRPIFLTEDAWSFFGSLLEAGKADIITDKDALTSRLSMLKHSPNRGDCSYRPPDLSKTLRTLWLKADEYRDLVGAGEGIGRIKAKP